MIGLAVITYKRFDFLIKCLNSLKENNWGGADVIVVVEDDYGYSEYEQEVIKKTIKDKGLYFRKNNGGVASAKNLALNLFISIDCDNIFLMEDDIFIKDPEVCHKYIDYAKNSGVEHMNFALHGPLNIGGKFIFEGKTVYPQAVGAFSYYTKNCIEKAGLFDENFKNAYEHVEHTWIISNLGLTTPFWNFIDHPDSDKMLEEIPGSIERSTRRDRSDYQINIDNGEEYWIRKHGRFI